MIRWRWKYVAQTCSLFCMCGLLRPLRITYKIYPWGMEPPRSFPSLRHLKPTTNNENIVGAAGPYLACWRWGLSPRLWKRHWIEHWSGHIHNRPTYVFVYSRSEEYIGSNNFTFLVGSERNKVNTIWYFIMRTYSTPITCRLHEFPMWSLEFTVRQWLNL